MCICLSKAESRFILVPFRGEAGYAPGEVGYSPGAAGYAPGAAGYAPG